MMAVAPKDGSPILLQDEKKSCKDAAGKYQLRCSNTFLLEHVGKLVYSNAQTFCYGLSFELD